jgi:hypothetical protein
MRTTTFYRFLQKQNTQMDVAVKLRHPTLTHHHLQDLFFVKHPDLQDEDDDE